MFSEMKRGLDPFGRHLLLHKVDLHFISIANLGWTEANKMETRKQQVRSEHGWLSDALSGRYVTVASENSQGAYSSASWDSWLVPLILNSWLELRPQVYFIMLSSDDDEFVNGAPYVYEKKKRKKRKTNEDGRGAKGNRQSGAGDSTNPLLKYLGAYSTCCECFIRSLWSQVTNPSPPFFKSKPQKLAPRSNRLKQVHPVRTIQPNPRIILCISHLFIRLKQAELTAEKKGTTLRFRDGVWSWSGSGYSTYQRATGLGRSWFVYGVSR